MPGSSGPSRSLRSEAAAPLRAVGGAALVDFVSELLHAADRLLGDVTAAFVIGSLANGDARRLVSDLDLLFVVAQPAGGEHLRTAGEALADLAAHCPLRGLEAVVYRDSVLAAPRYPLRYELNVNGGPAIPRRVSTAGDPPFWFLLDVAAAREHAITLAGPPAAVIIGPVPDDAVLAALADSLAWHRAGGGAGPDAVLNTCRVWHWLEHRTWLSKSDAGDAALARADARPFRRLIADALAARREQSDADLGAEPLQRLSSAVAERLRLVGPG